MKLSINPPLVMMRECPCSTKTQEVLGNPSPPPSRFSEAVGFAPLDPRGAKPMASENLSDFPRPSRFPSGFALGKSLGSREIGRRGWISQYLPRLGGARIQSRIIVLAVHSKHSSVRLSGLTAHIRLNPNII